MWLRPIRHDINDVAHDLERASLGAKNTKVDITFGNGSIVTIDSPSGLRGLVRPQDVATIEIDFIYEDGSSLAGKPISQYLPGFFYSDVAPDEDYLGTEYEQPETISYVRGKLLNKDWGSRDTRWAAVSSLLFRALWVSAIIWSGLTAPLSFF